VHGAKNWNKHKYTKPVWKGADRHSGLWTPLCPQAPRKPPKKTINSIGKFTVMGGASGKRISLESCWWTQNCSFHARRLSIMSIYRCYCCCCCNIAVGHKKFDISNAATLTTPTATTKTLNKNWYSHKTQVTFDKNTSDINNTIVKKVQLQKCFRKEKIEKYTHFATSIYGIWKTSKFYNVS